MTGIFGRFAAVNIVTTAGRSVVPTRSEDEIGSTKVTDRSNYTFLSKAQHKGEGDDESVDKFKTDKPVESNTRENAIETKLVEPEEESYKP